MGDFGISKQLDDKSELAQTSLGTPYYLAPEICNSQSYTNKVDIWMLGCTIHELCSLQKPFNGSGIPVNPTRTHSRYLLTEKNSDRALLPPSVTFSP